MASQISFLRRHGVSQATMAGKIFKTKIFERFALLRHFPDLTVLRYFYNQFFTGTEDINDDTMLLTITRLFGDHGITFLPATDFAPELLAKQGLMTRRPLNHQQWNDIQFGWKLAKSMGELDVGQSVAVKGRAALAVEAVEGTDECISRAGHLCRAGGFTVVKVAKPQQDTRFDMPTIGVKTIETMKAAGAAVLAIEADMTIVLQPAAVIELANRYGITVVAVTAASQDQLSINFKSAA
jgi:DUF1009 family protein